jgi:hypothetical protein
VKVPVQWVWANDPEHLPDDDHARCIAAPGERVLALGPHLFTLTTRPSVFLFGTHGEYGSVSFSTLQMEYRGLDWARGLAQASWGSDRFHDGSLGGAAQQAAGLALFATLERALLAGSVVRRRSSSPVHAEVEGPRPVRWRAPVRPCGHARRAPRPALLPLTVGGGGGFRQRVHSNGKTDAASLDGTLAPSPLRGSPTCSGIGATTPKGSPTTITPAVSPRPV